MKKIQNIHPILFAIYPIISLWSKNIEYIPFPEILFSQSISLLVTLILLLITWLALKDWEKGTLIVSGILFLFYSYGYVSNGLKAIDLIADTYLVVKILVPCWLGLTILLVWLVVKKINNHSIFVSFFFWFGSLMLIFSLWVIVGYYISPSSVGKTLGDEDVKREKGLTWQGESQPADIYYIILDGYGRQDTLLNLYDYDNSEFIQSLRDKGFYIATQSLSNYNQTALSLSSSLNMQYINYLENIIGKKSGSRNQIISLIRHSTVRDILEASDYMMACISTGYIHTMIEDADIFISYEGEENLPSEDTRSPNSFEWLLYDTTGFQGLLDAVYVLSGRNDQSQVYPKMGFHFERMEILNAFEHLDDFTDISGNYFIFAHILTPHPPFLFDASGGENIHFGGLTSAEGSHLTHGREDLREKYIEGYINQLKFTNSLTLEAIDQILDESENPPIIILQADHGPGAYLDWDSIQNSNVADRLSILTAIYFPDGNYENLYPSITPVNIFRAVFNTYFDGGFEMIEDRNYFSLWDYPYDFVEVTDMFKP